MLNYYGSRLIIIITLISSGCSILFPPAKGKTSATTTGSAIGDNSQSQAKRIERIKYYRKLIEDTLPFKQVIWEVTTSGEPIRNMISWDDFIYAETSNLKLRTYTTDIGHPQWVLTLESPLDFPLCPVRNLSQKETDLKNRIKSLRKEIDDAEKEKVKDEKKIKTLQERLRATTDVLRGFLTNDVIYYVSKGVLHCVDRWWGEEMWRKKLHFVPHSIPVASLSTVYINALDADRLYQFDIATRYERTWINVESPISSQPFYEEPNIYFASDNGIVYAYNTETGKKIWGYPTERTIKADILVDGDFIYIGSTDFTLYCINRHLGTLRWKYETGLPITSSSAVGVRNLVKGNETIIERTVYFKTDAKENFYALLLNPSSLANPYQLKWNFPQGKKFLLYGLACCYVLGLDNNTLYALDIEKGTVIEKYSLRDFPFRAVNTKEAILYLGTADGYIFAVREPPPQW